jgi:tetratricopeptide (TPR) repeat protein
VALRQAKATATKAVGLDETLAEAHLALGAAIFISDWDWDKSQQEIARAIQLDPKLAEAYHFRAKILAALNRKEAAIEAQKTASELDPFARPWALTLSYILARQYDAARAETLQRLEANPNDPMLHDFLNYIYVCQGMDQEAAEESGKAFLLSGDELAAALVRRAFQQQGYKGVIRWQMTQLKKKSTIQYVSPVALAYYHAKLGQREETIALLDEGYRQRAPALLWIQADPAFDFLHSDERFRSIITRIGLPLAY